MTLRTKRTILALLAIASLFFTAAIEWNRRPAALIAQGETATFTPTGTLTETPTGTLTNTPSATPTPSPTGTLTETPTGTLTATPTPTGTLTETPTGTLSPTPTPSFTPIFTPSWTPTLVGTPTPFPTPTFTPFGFVSPLTTPTFTPTVAVVTVITQPRKGDAVANYAPIMGTALTIGYRMYEIAVSPAGMDDWNWLYTSYDIIARGQLYLWDTTPFPDGYYDIRLRAIRDDGNYEDFIARKIEVRNANPPTPTPAFNDEGTLLPPAPISPLHTPTPTIRPRIVQNNPQGQGIFEPEVGETVWGFVDIIGTTNGSRANPFDRYEIAISVNGMDDWGWLYTGEEQMWQNTVYTFDSRRVPDGYYDIRLRIVYRDANYDDFILRYLNIANAGRPDPADKYPNGIYRPRNNKTIGGMVNFVGSALDADFMRWELHWSPAGQDQWSFLIDGDRQVARGVLARLDVGALKGAPIDVRLRVVRTDFNYDEYFVRNLHVTDPTPTPIYVPPPTAAPTVPPLATPTPPLPPPPAGPEPTWTPLG